MKVVFSDESELIVSRLQKTVDYESGEDSVNINVSKNTPASAYEGKDFSSFDLVRSGSNPVRFENYILSNATEYFGEVDNDITLFLRKMKDSNV